MEAFIERSRFGTTFYELSADRLVISGKRFLIKSVLEVELSGVSSNIERRSQRFYRPAILLCGLGIVPLVIILALYSKKIIPEEAEEAFLSIIGPVAAAFLIAGVRCIPPVEAVGFKSTLGKTLFVMINDKSYAAEFDAFVEKVRQNVRRCKEPGRTSWPAEAVPPIAVPVVREHWWKLSLALGIIGVGQPWIRPLAEWLYDSQFFISMACSSGGLGFCIASFLKKERFRYLSLLGVILAFIPPLYY